MSEMNSVMESEATSYPTVNDIFSQSSPSMQDEDDLNATIAVESSPNEVASTTGSDNAQSHGENEPLKIVYEGLEYSLANPQILIGRSDQCELRIRNDLQVSNRHCIIKSGRLCDNNSTNGTYLNDHKIDNDTNAKLRHGDKIRCGETVFEVIYESTPVAKSDNTPAAHSSSDLLATHTSGLRPSSAQQTSESSSTPSLKEFNSFGGPTKRMPGAHFALLKKEYAQARAAETEILKLSEEMGVEPLDTEQQDEVGMNNARSPIMTVEEIMQGDIRGNVEKLRDEFMSLKRKDNMSAKKKLQYARSHMDTGRKQIEDMKQEIQALQYNLLYGEKNGNIIGSNGGSQVDNQTLKNQLEIKTQELAAVHEALERAQLQHVDVSQSLTDANNTIKALQTECSSTKTELASLQQEILVLQDMHQKESLERLNLETTIASMGNPYEMELQVEKMAKLENDLADYKRQNSKMTHDLVDRKNQLDSTQSQLRQIQNELSEERKANAERIAKLEADLAAVVSTPVTLPTISAVDDSKIQNLQDELESYKQKLIESEQKKSVVEIENKNFQLEIVDLKADIVILEKNFNDADNAVTILTKEVETANASISELNQKLKELAQADQSELLSRDFEQIKKQLSLAEEAIEVLKTENHKFSDQVHEYNDIVTDLETQLMKRQTMYELVKNTLKWILLYIIKDDNTVNAAFADDQTILDFINSPCIRDALKNDAQASKQASSNTLNMNAAALIAVPIAIIVSSLTYYFARN